MKNTRIVRVRIIRVGSPIADPLAASRIWGTIYTVDQMLKKLK